MKNTKIVCTLGPASSDVKTLSKMLQAGMNVARLNFSHGDHASQLALFKNIREAEKKTGKVCAVMQDLQGPKIRIGMMPDAGVQILAGENFILDTGKTRYSEVDGYKVIPVQYKHLHQDVGRKDLILIEDGLIKTEVISIKGTAITVKALTPALVKSHKGINVPTASISADPLTPKDIADLKFGLKMGVDYVALSFVRKGSDIVKLRKLIRSSGSFAKVIAKIERHEALKNIKEILQETDAVMVARGDLGVETPAENVPIAQKTIVRLANEMARPVIIATEMLQSMITSPRATRAEVSDAANAIFDHADAVMLSNETATGKYPIQAIETLAKVALSVENYQKNNNWSKVKQFQSAENIPDEICHTATKLADETKARLIVTITGFGFTPKHVSKQRSFTEIITLTKHQSTLRELQLCWGLNKIFLSKVNSTSQLISFLKKQKLVRKGDRIVIVSNASSESREIILKKI